jgi:hypothetical protein
VSEAARKLGLSPATVRTPIKDGSLPASKVEDSRAKPHGYHYELDPQVVESMIGRWRGRRTHRDPDPISAPLAVQHMNVEEVQELPMPVPVPLPPRSRKRTHKYLDWNRGGWDKV